MPSRKVQVGQSRGCSAVIMQLIELEKAYAGGRGSLARQASDDPRDHRLRSLQPEPASARPLFA
jgi:hypothetical protein